MLKLLPWTLAWMLVATGFASAGGRAACRAEFGLATRLTCYAEQTLWSAGPLEVAAGIDLRYPGPTATPYTLVALYLPEWWATLEVGAELPGAFRLALAAGLRW